MSNENNMLVSAAHRDGSPYLPSDDTCEAGRANRLGEPQIRMVRAIRMLSCLILLMMCTACQTTPAAAPGAVETPPLPAVPAMSSAKPLEKLPPTYYTPYDPTTFHLAIGDVVEVSVFGFPDTVAVTPVAPDGKLYYHFMPGIPAVGRTPKAVEQDIEKSIQRFFNQPSVSILPRQFAENRFVALGKVVYPGVYPLDSALTIRQALARAGGLAQGIYRGTTIQLAALKDSYLLRKGQRIPVDLDALINRNDALQDIYIRPGDVLYIASGLGQEVYLMGAVGEEKTAAYTDGLTLVQLISGSSERGGGYKATAQLSQVVILRGALNAPQLIEVDLASILKGDAPDVVLLAGDIVYVPEKPYRFVRDLARVVVLTFVRAFASEAGAYLVEETVFPSSGKGGTGN